MAFGAIVRDELLLLGPRAFEVGAIPDKDVGRAPQVVIPVRADKSAVVGERDGRPEVV
jgi:hypothetical protein